MEQLVKMKLKLGVSPEDLTNDGTFQVYLDDAEQDILELTHFTEIPNNLLGAQVDLAIIYYNKQGIEGQISHSEGGVSRTYETDIPKDIMRKIRAARRLPR